MEEKQTEQIYVNQKEAAKILGIKPGTIKVWRRKFEDFPKPCRVSNNAVFFAKDEIIEWMEKRRTNA
ncbi:hypothetical protein JCM11957_07120 [Caminibacter profundus]